MKTSIVNGDQMPLHRHECSAQKAINIAGEETFVKENYTLSRERITTSYTQLSAGKGVSRAQIQTRVQTRVHIQMKERKCQAIPS